MNNQKRLYFGSVRIIESLPQGEMRTGWNLYEELDPICITAKPQVTCQYSKVLNRVEFEALLTGIRDEALATGRAPILQLETHGSPDGITLASGEFLPWAELRPLLTKINEATRLNLFVLLAACDGADLVQVVQPTERSAVLTLIGPKRKMKPEELQRANITFYRTLFEAKDAPAAWKAMNAVIDVNKITFAVFTAEFNFRYIMHNFLREHCTEVALAAREARIEAQAAQEGKPQWFIEQQRPALRAFLRDFQGHFALTKSNYFFCDLFPENANRFAVSFEDCRRAPAGD